MDLVGKPLGKYRIVEELGRGGMGVVYKGYDPTLERPVAIKVLSSHLIREEEFVQRFLREARAAARMHHPNIVVIHEVGQEGDWYYFAMEYISGKPLSQTIQEQGALPLPDVLSIVEQVAAALDYAHQRGVVHRDVKSANVLVEETGRVVLTDFGLVRAAEGSRLTATGVTLGTPEYMAPEQGRGEEATTASDLYALGVVAYEMLTGEVPFQAPTPTAVMVKHMLEAPPPLRARNPAVPEEVEQAVLWALVKEAKDRPASGAVFAAALRQGTEVSGLVVLGGPAEPGKPVEAVRPGRPPEQAVTPVMAPAAESRPPTPLPAARRVKFPKWAWLIAGVVVPAVLAGVVLLLRPWAGEQADQGTAVAQARATQAQGTVEAQAVATREAQGTVEAQATAAVLAQATATVEIQASATAVAQATTTAGAPVPSFCQSIDQTKVRPADGMEMLCVPAGEFIMGSSDSDLDAVLSECLDCEREWFSNEQPQRSVNLDAFWVDRTEVTNAQYRICVEAGVCAEPECWDDTNLNAPQQPVVCVDWRDAWTYCAWAGARLPTEAEWEKAARGTQGQRYPWGNAFDWSRLNYCDTRCDKDWKDGTHDDGFPYTAPVGNFPSGASPYGVQDMLGNVFEWVADWYDAEYYGRSPSQNPWGPDVGQERVLRGGAWDSFQSWARCAYRIGISPMSRSNYLGFRCVVPGR